MKFKKAMIVTFLLLAILTIGAVSASEDADDLTANEVGGGDLYVAESSVDDVMAETPEDTVGVTVEDFNVNINNKTFDVDNDQNEVVFNFTAPQGANGDFDIFVNDKYKYCIELSDETAGKTFNVTLSNLYITEYGTLPISVRYGDNQTDIGSFTVVKYYSKADFDTQTYDDVRDVKYRIYSFSKVPTTGTLIVYVNGKESYNQFIDSKDPYLQLYVDDLGITENAVYNIRSEYVVDGTGQVIALDNFSSEVICMPVSLSLADMDIDIARDYTSSIGYVSDDNGIRGPVTVYIDGNEVFTKTYTISDDEYLVSINEYTLPASFALGNHTVKIVYTRNGKEYTKEGNVTFYAEPKVINPGYTMTVGDNKYVTVNYYKGSTGTMVVYNTVKDSTVSTGWKKDTVFMTFDLNGNGTVYVPLNTLDVGYHGLCLNITLGTYSVESFVDFNVIDKQDTRPSPNLALDIADIKYGNDATIEITADSTFSGVVLVQIGEIKLNITVKDGFGTDKVSNLSANDNYYALATFTAKDSDAFKSDNDYKYFSVEKAWSSVYLDDYEFDLDYGDSLKINVTNLKGATGFIAKLDGENATVDGNSIIISGLTSGTHYLEVYTIPEDNYKEDSVEAVIRVASPKPKIIIDENIVLVKGSSINVNVTAIGAKGITAKIDDNDAAVNGYVIEIPGSLSVGTHTLTVTTIPDTGFEAVTQTATITVKKFQSAVSIQNDNLVFDYNKSAFTEMSFENATGVTAEVVDHSEANVTVKDNLITVSGLKPGSYTLKVTTVVDEAYDSATATANITVNKLKSIVSIRDNLIFDYNQSATMDVSYDADNVAAIVVDHPEANVTVSGFKVTVSGLNAGKYVLVITPDVDAEIYDVEGDSVNITVNKLQTGISIKDEVIVLDYKSNASTIVLSDAKFAAEVVGKPDAVTVNGNEITVSGLTPGNYTLKVSTDDDNYEAASATATIVVNKIKTNISIEDIAFTYGSSGSTEVITNASAVIAEVVGQPNAVLVVNGKKITVSGLAAGSYLLKITTDDSNYETSSATANITVNKAVTTVSPLAKVTTTYYSSGTLVVCLKDANGNPIQGKYVTVVFGKYAYDGWTNAKGRIYVTPAKNLAVGKYYPTLTFAGDENYTGSTGTAKIVVCKATPKFTYTAKVTYKRSNTKKYTIKLKTDLGVKMKNAYVVLKVNNVKYKGFTNSKGLLTFKLKKLTKKGNYVARLYFYGDSKYNAINYKVKIYVR